MDLLLCHEAEGVWTARRRAGVVQPWGALAPPGGVPPVAPQALLLAGRLPHQAATCRADGEGGGRRRALLRVCRVRWALYGRLVHKDACSAGPDLARHARSQDD